MPSKINLTENEKNNIITDIVEQLKASLNGNFEGKETITFQIPKMETVTVTTKPKIIISTTAGLKMSELVRNCTGEVGWHGFVERPDEYTFIIKDIVVYPQTVSSVTVDTDETEYALWCANISTEDLRTMRFQGHSHVNMACTPSSTDLTLYNNYLANLNNDDYYIFFICNKRGEINAWLYDLKTNTKYTKTDLEIIHETNMAAWFEEAKKNIKTPAAKPVTNAVNSYGQRIKYYPYDDMEYMATAFERHDYGTFKETKPKTKPKTSTKKEGEKKK